MRRNFIMVIFLAVLLMSFTAQARVVEIVISKKESPTFGGTNFGWAGQYERLDGIMKCDVDPEDPLNKEIVNIDKAPRNSRGHVEYDVDFTIFKPVDINNGNGRILFDTVNRGNMLTLSTFNNAPRGGDTSKPESAGNGFLMRKGYTIIASGWQSSYPEGLMERPMSFFVGLGSRLPLPNKSMMARLPVARNKDGSSITDMSREEYYDPPFNKADPEGNLIKYLTYPAANLDKSKAALTVRAYETDTKKSPPDMTWEYIDQWRIKLKVPAGYDQGAIYEFIYPAKDPIVYGLGFASIRDVVSFFRYENKDEKGNPNPLLSNNKNPIKAALAYGASQTGRLIKTFVYEGFNKSENGSIVFDGINTHIGGSRKNWLNGEFSHPGDIFGNDQFPFSYVEMTDHFTGKTDSMLKRCQESGTCPKIVHTDTETEIWSGAASLTETDTKGTHSVKLPENVRLYMYTGARHISGGKPEKGFCEQLQNPLDYSPISRAILTALDQWVTYGIEPPESRYPSLADKTFVPVDRSSTGFPEIPGVTYNGVHLLAEWLDYSVLPPKKMGEYPVYVMKTDKDGNGVSGVRLPAIEAPIATYTGWDLTTEGFGGDKRLCTASGSYIPFAETKAERINSGDPRLSIEERYPSHDAYVLKVKESALSLVRDRLLLWEDAEEIIKIAETSDIAK